MVKKPVYHEISDKIHILEFDSGNHMIEFVNFSTANTQVSGWDNTKREKGLFYTEKGYYSGRENEWAFGKDFKSAQETGRAVSCGASTSRIMEAVHKKTQELMCMPLIECLIKEHAINKRKIKFGEEGSELCIDRILCGDPNHWMKKGKRSLNNTVRFFVNYHMTCGNDEKKFIELASVICALVQIVSISGYAVEVKAGAVGHETVEGIPEAGMIFPIKNPDEPLDIQRISSIGLQGLLRGYSFDIYSQCFKGEPSWGLGRNSGISKELRAFLQTDFVIENAWLNEKEQSIYIDKIFRQIIQN